MKPTARQHNRILIVDDEAGNLRILHELLTKHDYEVHALKDSRAVERVLETVMPDLFLLDIKMPHLNGFDLAKMLQDDPKTSDIPIIFISASHEEKDIKRGFEIGGVDYITKPIRSFEVLARVATHIRVRWQQLALKGKVNEIQKLRKREQEEFARLEEMRNRFLQAATHDLKNPLYNVIGYLDLIEDFGSELAPEQLTVFLDHIELSTDKMQILITNMLDLFHTNSNQLQLDLRMINLGEYLQSALSTFHMRAAQKQIEIQLQHLEETVTAYLDMNLFTRVIDNVVSNAIKYSPEETKIRIRYSDIQHGVAIEVEDQGYGMTQDTLDNIFTAFYRSEEAAKSDIEGTGLGMSITKQIIEQHGGVIEVTSQVGQGTIIRIIIPHQSIDQIIT